MDEKLKGVLSYIFGWIGGLIILLAFQDNTKNTTFHACQSIVISLAAVVAGIAVGLFQTLGIFAIGFPMKVIFGFLGAIASSAIGIIVLVYMILGIVKVVNEEEDPKLPVVGEWTMKIFEKKINETPEVKVEVKKPKYDPNTGELLEKETKTESDTKEPVKKETKKKTKQTKTKKEKTEEK